MEFMKSKSKPLPWNWKSEMRNGLPSLPLLDLSNSTGVSTSHHITSNKLSELIAKSGNSGDNSVCRHRTAQGADLRPLLILRAVLPLRRRPVHRLGMVLHFPFLLLPCLLGLLCQIGFKSHFLYSYSLRFLQQSSS